MTSPSPIRPRTSAAPGLARAVLTLLSALLVTLLGLTATSPSAHAVGNPVPPKKAPARIEVANPYVPQTSCDPVPKPGVSAFYSQMIRTYRTGRSLGIIHGCSVVNTAGGVSEHKEGRALDWGLYASRKNEKKVADQFLAWALAKGPDGQPAYNARRMGIMYMIWNRRIWGSYSSGWRPYTGSHPHTDHIHLSFGWNGAMKRTSWWTGKAAAVDYGPCRTSKSRWAPKYTKPNYRPCGAAATVKAKPKPKQTSGMALSVSGTNPKTLTAALVNRSTRKPITNAPVTLRVKWAGTTKWVTVKSGLRTNSAGKVAYRVNVARAGYFQYLYGGTSTVASAYTSAPLLVPPKQVSSFALTVSGSSATKILTGTLVNKTTGKPIAYAPVTLRVKWYGSTAWDTVTSGLKTNSAGQVAYSAHLDRAGYFQYVYGGTSSVSATSTAAPLLAPPPAPKPTPSPTTTTTTPRPSPTTTTPRPSPTSSTPSPTSTSTPPAPWGTFWYTVRAGENLRSIADRYGVHRSELRVLNGIDWSQDVTAGQRILVLTEQGHAEWHRRFDGSGWTGTWG